MSESNNQNSGNNQAPRPPERQAGPNHQSQGGQPGQAGSGNNRNRNRRRRGGGGFNRGPRPEGQQTQGQSTTGPQTGPEGQNNRPRQPQHNHNGPRQQGQGQGQNNQPNNQNGQPGFRSNQPQQNRGPNNRGPHSGPRHNNQQRHSQGGHHNNRPQHNPGPPKPKNGVDAIFEKYENLMYEHGLARRKYFDLYYTADDNQHRKLEENFHRTLESLRRYEESLEPWKKEFLLKKVELYPFDTTYSVNRSLIPETPPKPNFGLYPGLGDTPPDAPFEDPHLLKTQKMEKWQEDKEESAGTIEDYKRLKGLV